MIKSIGLAAALRLVTAVASVLLAKMLGQVERRENMLIKRN